MAPVQGEVEARLEAVGSHVEWHLNGNLKHFSASFLCIYIFNLTLTENLNEMNVSCCVVSCSVLFRILTELRPRAMVLCTLSLIKKFIGVSCECDHYVLCG